MDFCWEPRATDAGQRRSFVGAETTGNRECLAQTTVLYNSGNRGPVSIEEVFFRGEVEMANRNPVEAEEEKQRREKMPGRKPYAKPAFRFERVFETQALSCGKLDTASQCSRNRKAS